ncbi:hypothetical protein [Saccharothrix sp. NRRL B-16314]|uniref:hypothetical protein n=1 Tax=Saccharothrix sp. NRRL B-16314 TaxID=1463825 RepID=UPI0012DECFF3|nr:hypothetical protein [Saccharothrix sp. NRRL B-16314]
MAEEAQARIQKEIFDNELLSEAAPAVASSLVHALWCCSPLAEDIILGLLADISGGEVDERDPLVYGMVSAEKCLKEVRLGFPAYVEILETGENVHSRSACVDLIFMCGISSGDLRQRAVYFLRSALRCSEFVEQRQVIESSLSELED